MSSQANKVESSDITNPGVINMFVGSGLLGLAAIAAIGPVFGLPTKEPFLLELGVFLGLFVGLPFFAGGCIRYAKYGKE